MLSWMTHKLESWNHCWEKYEELQICRWYHFNGKKWRGTKEPFGEGERGEWKIWLKIQHSKNKVHDIQFHHFMEKTEREKWKQCHILFYWPPKSLHMMTAVTKLKDTCSLGEELWQSQALLKKKKKKSDITLPSKVHIVKAMVFPLAMYGCES